MVGRGESQSVPSEHWGGSVLAGLDGGAGAALDGDGWAGWQALERTAQCELVATAEGDGRYACDVPLELSTESDPHPH